MNEAATIDSPVADQRAALDERISAHLISRGRLKEADLVRARRLHEENPEGNFVGLITRLGLVSEKDSAEALSEVLGLRGRAHECSLQRR